MTEYAAFEDILGTTELDVEDVTLPNGKVVQVKGLSRYEYMLAVKASSNGSEIDGGKLERGFIKLGMLQPKLNDAQVETWTKSTNNSVVSAVTDVIRKLSGMDDDAEKSDVS